MIVHCGCSIYALGRRVEPRPRYRHGMTDRFEDVDMSGAQFRAVRLARARFRDVDLAGVVMRGVVLVDAEINGDVRNLTINGVDVGPLVEAELDRRHAERAKMRPTDPAGFREA